MTDDDALATLAQEAGLILRYHDLQGYERVMPPDTQRAFLAANGIAAETQADVLESLGALRAETAERWFPQEVIVEADQPAAFEFGLGAVWELRLDGERDLIAQGPAMDAITLPPLAAGVYHLRAAVADRVEEVRVLAAPRRLPGLNDVTGSHRIWGMTAALYGLQSARNTGLGDYADLGDLAAAAGAAGASFVGINPVHNMGFGDPAFSPYSPSHRGFLSSAHIAPDRIPGLENCSDVTAMLQQMAPEIATLREGDKIAYDAHKALHQSMLTALFDRFETQASGQAQHTFEAFINRGAEDLTRFAGFEALSDIHGPDWRNWPEALAAPDPQRVRFHGWLQWVADTQLAEAQKRAKVAGCALGLYLDLAVGPRRSGAESWCERDVVAQGISIGAPPDQLSPEGQNWELAGFSPRKLQAAHYRPFRRILRQVMRHAGMVRIDHVLGLSRSFWIPDGGGQGGYIRQPFEALLAIIRIEAARHDCIVVGEDLGLVPEGFRETTRRHGFYGYSVLQYEKDHEGRFHPPGEDRQQVLSCFATHDTPTVRGFETGRDIKLWREMGWTRAEDMDGALARRATEVAGLKALAGTGADFATSVHAILARSGAAMISIQLDDILGVSQTQNLPGTIDEHPNWRRKYATSVAKLGKDARLAAVGALMTAHGRRGSRN